MNIVKSPRIRIEAVDWHSALAKFAIKFAVEAAARDLLVRYPDTHDGWDRLGMVHEARGENVQAAECYRKLIAFLRHNPDYADLDMAEHYTKLSAKLDPPAT